MECKIDNVIYLLKQNCMYKLVMGENVNFGQSVDRLDLVIRILFVDLFYYRPDALDSTTAAE